MRAVRRRDRFVVGEELVEFFKSVFGSLFVFDFAIAELSSFSSNFFLFAVIAPNVYCNI